MTPTIAGEALRPNLRVLLQAGRSSSPAIGRSQRAGAVACPPSHGTGPQPSLPVSWR